MRFLPGDSSAALCELSRAQSRGEQSAGNKPAGGCAPIGSSPGLIYRNSDQRGSQKQHDGAHQTIVQESQGHRNARGPTSAHISSRDECQRWL